MNMEEIRNKIVELSGSGKKVAPGARKNGIYTSFTVPGLDDMKAVRDTKKRFDDFDVPRDLSGKNVIDIGSNVGAVAFEFAQRRAAATGVEYRQDRVELCWAISSHTKLNARFYQADFNEVGELWRHIWYRQYDIVWCSSVDEYINNLPEFYKLLYGLCSDKLYFESNLQVKDSDLLVSVLLKDVGFKNIQYVGNGHSGGIARKRKLFTAEVSKL